MTEATVPPRRRRSLHFVPGGNERMFEKALGLPADALILDLEDAVTPANKEAARQRVCEWLGSADFGGRECLVRINPQDTPWGADDLAAIAPLRPAGLVVPKVASRADVDAIAAALASVEQGLGEEPGALPLVLIGSEVPEAVFNLPEMVRNPRVNGVTWGPEDLSGVLGAKASRDADGHYLEVFSYVRATCLLAAAAADVQPIDAVYVDIDDLEGLQKECRAAADMGYTGKITIHPKQIDIVNAVFTPSRDELEEAAALLQAFEEHRAAGRMAFAFRGRMVDAPHLKRARRILAEAAGSAPAAD